MAKRCSACGLNWPIGYVKCYQCGGSLWKGSTLDPMPIKDAERLKAHYDFEQWLQTDEGRTVDARVKAANDAREAEFHAIAASLTGEREAR